MTLNSVHHIYTGGVKSFLEKQFENKQHSREDINLAKGMDGTVAHTVLTTRKQGPGEGAPVSNIVRTQWAPDLYYKQDEDSSQINVRAQSLTLKT